MSPWVTVVIAVLGMLGGGGGLVALAMVREQRRKIGAETEQLLAQADDTVAGTVKVLLGSATSQAKALDTELRECRAELNTVHRKADGLERQVDVLDRKMVRLIAMIHDPYMTMERLRVMVPDPHAERT